MNLEIEWASERLILLAEKAIVWPRTSSLIVADLHFGKSAAFRVLGIPVPESTTAHDLHRLDGILHQHSIRRLIVLGDFFHSASGLQPEVMRSVEDWCGKNHALEIILVPGNHDKKSGAPPACWNIESVADGWTVSPFSFCHEPREIAGNHVFAGHIHPAISLREKFGSGMRAPCFWFTKKCAILPAFGSFTGTHAIRPARGDRVYAVGFDEVVDLAER